MKQIAVTFYTGSGNLEHDLNSYLRNGYTVAFIVPHITANVTVVLNIPTS